MFDLAGEVVLVTGGAQGIGAAVVRSALEWGARVSFCDIDRERGAELAAELGAHSHFVEADVTSEASVQLWVESAREAFGTAPTGLVNNAGKNSYADAATMTVAEWDEFFALDLRSAWLCARAVLPDMLAARHGSIVSISSIHARLTIPGMFPYAAAKAGLLGLTRALALDTGASGVRANSVSPGLVWTQINERHFSSRPDELASTLAAQPMARAGEPAEIASVVCFLLSRNASFVNGADWPVDGGYSARLA